MMANAKRKKAIDEDILPGLQRLNYISDVLVLIDTHCDAETGELVVGGSKGSNDSVSVTEVTLHNFQEAAVFF